MGSLMDDFIDYTGSGGFHDIGAPLVDQDTQQLQQQHPQQYMAPPMGHLPDGTSAMMYNAIQQPGPCDVKPRLNKLQHDFLEAEYQKQPKPNTMTKKDFAHRLNVTLDKVNNWFQNRRAKTKQDIKKARSSMNLYNSGVNSDTEPSPFQPSGEYAAMMQQMGADAQGPHGIPVAAMPPSRGSDQINVNEYHSSNPGLMPPEGDFGWQAQVPQEFYDATLDMNRRTLTQEAFDAISRNGGMVNGQGQFEGLDAGFAGDQDMMAQIFGGHVDHPKGQDLTFPYPIGAPMSSHDSTIPSSISDQSYQFPSNDIMQGHAAGSASGSDWTDSRSSSLSLLQPVSSLPEMSTSHPQLPANNSQWQPGRSVPVDVNQHYEEFRQAAQGRGSESQPIEQPIGYPSEAFARRNSQAAALAQSLGNVNIHTPQPEQNSVFKSPAPPVNGSIAARRQRPRPANLGVASLRSVSYTGPGQPGSPSHPSQHANLTQDQQLRRIRSAVAMNGGVAHGRIMKSTPGSAQRSPVNWTFSNGMVSPHLARHMSHGNLAPPTPMSPREHAQFDQASQASSMQPPNQMMHNPSISESDFENNFPVLPYHPSVSVPAQSFSSPPHTPMYHEYPILSQRMSSHVITENTPPQSAPAGQSCFPSNLFGPPAPQQPFQQTHHHSQSVQNNVQVQHFLQRPQQVPPVAVEQQPVMPTVTFAPSQQSNVTTGPPPGVPLQFANGIPTVNAEGTVKMSFPPQAQLMQQQSSQLGTPPQQQYAFVTQSGGSPSLSTTAVATPQQRGELFVHEYSPPDAVKRSVTPRKTVEAVPAPAPPKNYTFTNHGPVDYEKRAKKDGRESSSSCSPESSSSSTNGSS